MLHELIVFGGVAFWIITAIVFLLAICLVESVDEFSGASVVQIGYVLFLVAFTNITLDLSPYWWCPIPYLIIGVLWFLFMMTHRVKQLRRWIDEQADPDDFRRKLKENKLSFHRDREKWLDIYKTEPSWPKFFDRVVLWPLSMLKFATRDLLRLVYDACTDALVRYRNSLLGIK